MRLVPAMSGFLLFSLVACSPPPTKDIRNGIKDQAMPVEAHVPDDEMNIEAGIRIEARILFEQKKFKKLNELARRYLSSGETTPAGEPKLKFLYVGLIDYAGYQTPSQTETPNVQQWNVMFDRVQEWIAKEPSPAAYITLAKFHHHLAWLWRGDGYAGDVRKDAWKPFSDQIATTRDVLMAHREAAIDPEWFITMENVARAQSMPDEEANTLLADAIGKHKYYYRIYQTAVLRLLPQWGGSWDEVEQFANSAADTTKDKDGDTFYTRVYMAIGDCGCGIFRDSNVNWSRMKSGFEEIVKRYPDEWNLNNFAYYACQAQDRETAKALFARFTRKFSDAWNYDDAAYEKCKAWAS